MGDQLENHIRMLDKKVDGLTDRFDELASMLGKGLNKIEERFEAIDRRFDGIEKRLDGMDERFDAMDKKIDDLRGDTKHTIATLEQGFYEVKAEIRKIGLVTGYEGVYENTVGLGV